MACCGDASGWAKVGFICIFLAFGLQSAAFLTNYWMVYNTAKDLFDIRVGLLWYTNCTSACATSTTPSSYHSLFFTLAKILEGVTIGLFFIIVVIYAFYVLADRSRTRTTAKSIIILLVTSELFPIGGIVLWILQIDFPYFLAWSAGMSMIATGLAFFSMLCLIPDLKEYPYYNKMAILPMDNNFDDMQYRKYDTKKNTYVDQDKLDREPKRKPHLKDPYSMKDSFMDDEIDRKALMVTPSRPPRYDFLKQNLYPLSTKF